MSSQNTLTGLINIARHEIMTEVIEPICTKDKKINRCVLVMDRMATRVLSSCCKMHIINDKGVILVEDLLKKREPLPMWEAIYLITPDENSIDTLIRDFSIKDQPMYKSAHVYFIHTCDDELFDRLKHTVASKKIKTLKEVNVAFLACETQVFSLDWKRMFRFYYNPSFNDSFDNSNYLENIAIKIATVCLTLKEYPSVRYGGHGRTAALAQMVQDKLDLFKADNPKMGDGVEKELSQLIILDRGFDCVTPVLHELTYQAMAYDIVPIINDTYKYDSFDGSNLKEVLLDDDDALWAELKHGHIAEVSKKVTEYLKTFIERNRVSVIDKNNSSVRHLSYAIKKMPQHQKELVNFSTHMSLVQECLNFYSSHLKMVCSAEQDLATGTDITGHKIKDYLKTILLLLANEDLSSHDKIRIIILYVLHKNGISEENLDKLVRHSKLSDFDKQTILNLNFLGVDVITRNVNSSKFQISRRNRITEDTYNSSRWTPVVKDVIQDCIEDKLDSKDFPYIRAKPAKIRPQIPTSVRYGQWRSNKKQQPKTNPSRVIIFIIGGVTFSEIRSAYEVTNDSKTWEVIIGSSNIITPVEFIKNLATLHI